MKPIVWVEGIIGSGKTTLTNELESQFDMRIFLEPVDGNPFLERFYQDPKRWAFPMQIWLLHQRYAMQKEASYMAAYHWCPGAVLDRGLPGDRVFAKLHMLEGNMDPLEWETYEMAYEVMTCSIVSPSLLIYLDVEPDVALSRIKHRGRGAESGIQLDYLEKLRRGYLDLLVEIQSGQHAWSRGMDVMRIAWNIDHHPLDQLMEAVRDKLKLPERKRRTPGA